jgi:hypothetical protein
MVCILFTSYISHHEGHEEHEDDHGKSERTFVDLLPQSEISNDSFLRVLRALRGDISLCVLFNDPSMLYCDEPSIIVSGE